MSQKSIEIKPIKTSKDDIKQPNLAKDDNMYIPPLGSSVIISGKSGSGKSTLLANYLTKTDFYKGWFDHIFLFSPTANGDDIQRSLNIPKQHVFTDLDEVPEILEVILNSQQEKLDEANSAADVPQYCLIFDDVIGDVKFMNDVQFTRCFYQVRHVNCTTFICTQHFKRVPRVCRLQANFIHFFEGSVTEVDTVTDEFAPPMVHPKAFKQLVVDATKEPYSFLTINMKVHSSIRFRRNLGEIIDLKNYGWDSKNEIDHEWSETQQDKSSKLEQNESPGSARGYSRERIDRGQHQQAHRSIRKRQSGNYDTGESAIGGRIRKNAY
jgi:hypothetical protein